jgi:hypothetical protein
MRKDTTVQAAQKAPKSRRTRTRETGCGALRLLDSWMSEDSGYDEEVWPAIKRAIDANRLSARKRFRD